MSGGTDTEVHLSIGEVLALLQEEFPDCTISKIRFLESQGLIQPDRTASGYRKFYDADIERLRWILRQQRDHFLPLKVIRKMLDEGVDRYDPGGGAQPTLFTPEDESSQEDQSESEDEAGDKLARRSAEDGDREPLGRPDPMPPGRTRSGGGDDHRSEAGGPSRSASGGSGAGPARSGEPAAASADTSVPAAGSSGPDSLGAQRSPRHPAVASAPKQARRNAPSSSAAAAGGPGAGETEPGGEQRKGHETPADVVAALQEDPRGRTAAGSDQGRAPSGAGHRSGRRARAGAGASRELEGDAAMEEVSTAEELCAATGIDGELLAGLERFGLVEGWPRGGEVVYGRDAHAVARIAARYAAHGVEPRHLRMYLVAAEREAGFIEQLAVPLLKQRNPAARAQAVDLVRELEGLGVELHALLLRRELGPQLGA